MTHDVLLLVKLLDKCCSPSPLYYRPTSVWYVLITRKLVIPKTAQDRPNKVCNSELRKQTELL